MPTISNVVLSLQKGGTGTNRTAKITFTTSFDVWEIIASEVFIANVSIKSNDGDRTFFIGSTHIHASTGSYTASLTKTLTRANFDEDVDVYITHDGEVILHEDIDEWMAIVAMAPMVFAGTTGTSPVVTGSWGLEGTD